MSLISGNFIRFGEEINIFLSKNVSFTHVFIWIPSWVYTSKWSIEVFHNRSKLWELFWQVHITWSANKLALKVIQTCKNSPHIHGMNIKINKNVILEFRNSSSRTIEYQLYNMHTVYTTTDNLQLQSRIDLNYSTQNAIF